jgi:hypothetical protein
MSANQPELSVFWQAYWQPGIDVQRLPFAIAHTLERDQQIAIARYVGPIAARVVAGQKRGNLLPDGDMLTPAPGMVAIVDSDSLLQNSTNMPTDRINPDTSTHPTRELLRQTFTTTPKGQRLTSWQQKAVRGDLVYTRSVSLVVGVPTKRFGAKLLPVNITFCDRKPRCADVDNIAVRCPAPVGKPYIQRGPDGTMRQASRVRSAEIIDWGDPEFQASSLFAGALRDLVGRFIKSPGQF